MIPKKIHYCWFGRNPKSEIIQKCIASWKEFCPDYEIIEWNEDNFDVNSIPYTAAAYADKKWAFVSDYARLKIVYENGGIYLDTDVLLHNSLDELLQYECWLASDDVRYINTGLGFGAIKEQSLVCALLQSYHEYGYDPAITCVTKDTQVIERQLPLWKKSDRSQNVAGAYLIGLKDYGKYATHLYTFTWAAPEEYTKRTNDIQNQAKNTLVNKLLWKLKCLVRNPRFIQFFDRHKGTFAERVYVFCAYDLLDNGPIYFVKRLMLKLFK